jgi:hypothetical protein
MIIVCMRTRAGSKWRACRVLSSTTTMHMDDNDDDMSLRPLSPLQSRSSTPSFLSTPSWGSNFEVPQAHSSFQSPVPISSSLNSSSTSSWHTGLFNNAQTHFPPTSIIPSISHSQNSGMFGFSTSSSPSLVEIFFTSYDILIQMDTSLLLFFVQTLPLHLPR